MIAVDTSAVVAILEQEEDSDSFISVLEGDDLPLLSAATFVELHAVMKHKGGKSAQEIVDRFIKLADIRIEPLTPNQAILARNAYHRYSVLNLGDCYSYALAKDKEVPLLYKGDDFSKTDVKRA